ncbi:hypothetical protein F0562_030322 [Nyssa sinensis]|uniref:LOB domain-containing protein n=1 Tax=Nyssa sinensis TaxID=561372 RepID=A0A5J5AY77_9ASTE|nr:hypothetical protein F0562_030322 [Nyssa sinensis]
MSCNGCRVLRKGCSASCLLRHCLQWIENPQAQCNATLFVSKFFGRRNLMNLISVVPENMRPALFQSLLFDACGRMVNPVNGVIGLLFTGNWNVCQTAVEMVLAKGTLQPLVAEMLTPNLKEASKNFLANSLKHRSRYSALVDTTKHQPSNLKIPSLTQITVGRGGRRRKYPLNWHQMGTMKSFNSDEPELLTSFGSNNNGVEKLGGKNPKLLKLFV